MDVHIPIWPGVVAGCVVLFALAPRHGRNPGGMPLRCWFGRRCIKRCGGKWKRG